MSEWPLIFLANHTPLIISGSVGILHSGGAIARLAWCIGPIDFSQQFQLPNE
jgi:hypothetical protein